MKMIQLMNRAARGYGYLLFAMLLLLGGKHAHAACTSYPPAPATYTVGNLGTVSAGPDNGSYIHLAGGYASASLRAVATSCRDSLVAFNFVNFTTIAPVHGYVYTNVPGVYLAFASSPNVVLDWPWSYVNVNSNDVSSDGYIYVGLYQAGPTPGGVIPSGQVGVTTVDGRVIGEIYFGGATILPNAPTCSLSTSSATFDMGVLKTSDFNRGAGATYNWVADQSLRANSNCNASTASMTFVGTADPAYPNAFKNNGTAKGVALQLWQANGSQAIPNSATPIRFNAGANQNFTFSARYLQTESTVTAGTVSAVATVTVNYQ
jgi:minor fimbrial subunit